MYIDINLVNSLKVGEYIKVNDDEVLACVNFTQCDDCFFDNGPGCKLNVDCNNGHTDLMYRIFKQKQ